MIVWIIYECKFKVHSDSKVDIEEYSGVASGSKNVFQVETSTQGSPQIADDEFTEIFVFELDSNQDDFFSRK